MTSIQEKKTCFLKDSFVIFRRVGKISKSDY
jgi:hypothetical protein